MHFSVSTIATFLLLLQPIFAGIIPRNDLERRDDVATCKAVLIALQASAFCSSFVPIADSTTTVVSLGAATTVTVTGSAQPCTITSSGSTVNVVATGSISTVVTTSTSTSTVFVTVTGPSTAAVKARRTNASLDTTKLVASTSATKSTSTVVTADNAKATISTSGADKTTNTAPSSSSAAAGVSLTKCFIPGIPQAAQIFICDVIKEASVEFVHPKTKIVTSLSVKTLTATVTPKTSTCATVQGTANIVTSLITVTQTSTQTREIVTTATTVVQLPACPTFAANSGLFESGTQTCPNGLTCSAKIVGCVGFTQDQCYDYIGNDPNSFAGTFNPDGNACIEFLSCC